MPARVAARVWRRVESVVISLEGESRSKEAAAVDQTDGSQTERQLRSEQFKICDGCEKRRDPAHVQRGGHSGRTGCRVEEQIIHRTPSSETDEVFIRVSISEDEFELVMGLFEILTGPKLQQELPDFSFFKPFFLAPLRPDTFPVT
ncbi:hypothetical protein B0H13DRAFT_1855944 [Mycena leptocephala]|nr:hypothetical protein B0H13DRAFT_1855944 [Mycena leptocephala]